MLERLTSYQQLVEVSGGDPFVRYSVSPRFTGPGFRLRGAFLFARRGLGGPPGLAGLGPTADLDALLDLLRRDQLLDETSPKHITIPRAAAAILDRHFEMGPGGDWEWMWTTTVPALTRAESQVVELAVPVDADRIAQLLDISSPRWSLNPHQDAAEAWVGVVADGELVACAGAERTDGGTAHLGSIAVHQHFRGRGLGAAVTAALTRRFVSAEGVCTLGMYSDNNVARSLYVGLGYRDDHFWSSRTVLAVRH